LSQLGERQGKKNTVGGKGEEFGGGEKKNKGFGVSTICISGFAMINQNHRNCESLSPIGSGGKGDVKKGGGARERINRNVLLISIQFNSQKKKKIR